MSTFTTRLLVSPLPNGRDWELGDEFDYHVGCEESQVCIHVPAGFVTDFASVPRVFWFLPDWATYSKAPVLHDYLYQTKLIMGKPITRKEADRIFLEAMYVDWRHHRSRFLIARLEYLMVRWFGWLPWRY